MTLKAGSVNENLADAHTLNPSVVGEPRRLFGANLRDCQNA